MEAYAVFARRVSFGGASAIVTGMALIIGLGAAAASTTTIVGSLLIVALADNLTDHLSMHIYQESEHIESALAVTIANFLTRIGISLSFIPIVLLLPAPAARLASLAWGFLLLAGLTALIARERRAPLAAEIGRHFAVATGVLLASWTIGRWVHGAFG
jgi:VIT1/CCC1 family predicted Fe2+/Mn2+ transporter